ncbi:MAG: TetR/AcrR family transcriptional regulator [Gemmatimonadaceae bacterium]
MTTGPDGETEERILQAARTVFVRHGTGGARMQDIAQEAGVNQALLHYYFRSKDRLAQAVFRDIAGRVAPAIVLVFGSDSSIEQKVEQFVQLYIDTLRQSPFIPGYIIAELHFNPERLTTLAADIAAQHLGDAMKSFLPRLAAQLEEQARIGAMRSIAVDQFLVNMVSLCVFPFAASPVLRLVFGQDDADFSRFLDERRKELPDFILNALRP